jgi:hypothetical protein
VELPEVQVDRLAVGEQIRLLEEVEGCCRGGERKVNNVFSNSQVYQSPSQPETITTSLQIRFFDNATMLHKRDK